MKKEARTLLKEIMKKRMWYRDIGINYKTAYMLKYRLRRGDLTERTAELYLKKLGYKKIIKYKKQ